MSKTLKLWVDADTGFLYQSFNSSSSLPKIEFLQGDKVQVEVHMVKVLNGFMSEVDFPENSILRMALGKIDASATSGTYTISYGGNTTAPISYSASESDIQTALNGLASITSAGGVTVTKFSNSLYKVSFNQVGVRTQFTIDGSLLTPPCSTKSTILKAGSVSVKGEYIIKVKQSPVAFQDSFTSVDAPAIHTTVLTANQSKRVSIYPEPKGGTWSLTGTGDLKLKVIGSNDGVLNPDWWNENYTARVSVNALATDTQFSYLNYDVVKVDSYTWDFSLKSYATPPEGYTMPFDVSSSGLIGYSGRIGSLDLNTAEVEYLLNGASSVSTNLELELEEQGGNKKTLLQTTCTIKNDLIDQNNYSPISYGGNVSWGEIGGTIANQLDLQGVLDGKLNLSGGTMSGQISGSGSGDFGLIGYQATDGVDPINGGAKLGSQTAFASDYAFVGVIGDNQTLGLFANGSTFIKFGDDTTQSTAGLPLTGGTMSAGALIDFTVTSGNDSEIGAWGFGVENTNGNVATVEPSQIQVYGLKANYDDPPINTTSTITINKEGLTNSWEAITGQFAGFSLNAGGVGGNEDGGDANWHLNKNEVFGHGNNNDSPWSVNQTGVRGNNDGQVWEMGVNGLLFIDGTTQVTAGLPLSGGTLTGSLSLSNDVFGSGVSKTISANAVDGDSYSGFELENGGSAYGATLRIKFGNTGEGYEHQAILSQSQLLFADTINSINFASIGHYGISWSGNGANFNLNDFGQITANDGDNFPYHLDAGSVGGTYDGATWSFGAGGILFADSTIQTTAGIPEAPNDGNYYVRKNGAWYQCTVHTQGGKNYLTI